MAPFKLTGTDEQAVAAAEAALERAEAWRQAWQERWGEDGEQAMSRLIQRFPTLRGADGIDPWDLDRFLAWARRGETSAGTSCAARFILSVWNRTYDWRSIADGLGFTGSDPLDRFDIFEAIAVWDEEHVRAFRSWAELPFWP